MIELTELAEQLLDKLPWFLRDPDPNIYLSDNFVVLDLETNTKGHNRSPSSCWQENSIVCGSWCAGIDGPAQHIYGNEYHMAPLLEAIEEADFCVAYNGKFDLGYLRRAGVDLHKVLLYDPMIGEYVLAANKKVPLSLDAVMTRRYGVSKARYVQLCMEGGVDPEDIPRSLLRDRCNSDILMTRQLFLDQREEIADKGLLPCVFTRCVLSPALADIESVGACVDKEAVEAQYRESSLKLAAVEQQIEEFAEGINMRSPKQVSEFLYENLKFPVPTKGRGRNKTEHRTTKTEDIIQFTAKTKRQEKFIELKREFARHNADVGKTLSFFHGVATDNLYPEPIFFAQFNQCVTVTHRLSSSGITRTFEHIKDAKGKAVSKSTQFQNFPRKYKPLFKARKKGWLVGEADGSQLEFRVAAFLGQCRVATQEIINSVDVHKQTAMVINDVSIENVTGAMRTDAKKDTFKPLYGGQTGTPEQMKYYEWFREHYEGIGKVQQQWKDDAVISKQVKLPHGFIFYFPNASLNASGYVQGSTNICNYPVQHFATAEIIPIAIVHLWHFMKELESFIVNTIHDSVVSELHPDECDLYRDYALEAFTTFVYRYLLLVYGVRFNVPLGIGCKIGEHWGTGTEYKCSPMPPFIMDGIDYTNLQTEWVED